MSTSTATEVREKPETKLPSFWGLKFHNDDYTPMDFVVLVFMGIMGLDFDASAYAMMTIHNDGSMVIGRMSHDVAETKKAEIDKMSSQEGHPLLVNLVELLKE